MTEHDIQNQIRIALSERGCVTHRTNSGRYYTKDGRRPVTIGTPGQSDLQGHRPDGKCFYIEVKRSGQNPRQNQRDFLQAMKNSGAIAGVAHSAEEALKLVFEEEET